MRRPLVSGSSRPADNRYSSALIGLWTVVALLAAIRLDLASAEDTPPSAPTDVAAHATEDAIHIRWRTPPGIVRGFSIGYGYGPEPYQELPIGDPSITSYTIHGPFDSPGRDYTVYVLAFNDKGFSDKAYTSVRIPSSADANSGGDYVFDDWSPLSFNVYLRQGEGRFCSMPPSGPPGLKPGQNAVSLEAPFNLKSNAVSANEVLLSWDDVDGGGMAEKVYTIRHGPYPVQYDAQGKANFTETWTKENKNVAVKNLKPNTKYEFSVRYTLGSGEQSDWSLSTTAETDKTAPSSPPLITKFVLIDPQSVYISWKPPIEINAPLSGFEVFHTMDEASPDLAKWTRVSLSGEQKSYTIQNLPAGRIFVQVRAVNAYGPGPFSPASSEEIRLRNAIDHSSTPSSAPIPGLHPASGTAKSPLWIPPKDKQIEKMIGDFLSIPCESRSGHVVKSVGWTYPNGTRLPFNKGKTRVYAEKDSKLNVVKLVFSKLQYTDSGHYHCVATVNDRVVRESLTLRVLYSPTSDGGELLKCDFELSNLCGWTSDASSPLQWHWVEAGRNLHGRFALVLPKDHTTERTPKADNGHYVYAQGLQKDKGSGRLVSPTYTSGFSLQSCFSLWYHPGPHSSGKLRISMVPVEVGVAQMEHPILLLAVDLRRNGGNWNSVRVPLKAQKEEFKIVVESVKEEGDMIVALDDVELLAGGCPEWAKQGDHGKGRHLCIGACDAQNGRMSLLDTNFLDSCHVPRFVSLLPDVSSPGYIGSACKNNGPSVHD